MKAATFFFLTAALTHMPLSAAKVETEIQKSPQVMSEEETSAVPQHQHPKQQEEKKPDQHRHPTPQQEKKPDKMDASQQHPEHDMSKMPEMKETDMMSTVTGGPFKSMHAIASGTSLLPASTPGYMWHWMKDDWVLMMHGDLKVGLNHQGGPRGVTKAESQNWLMMMAERPWGEGRLMLRGMFSAEPLTAPHGGFPELFQTGEIYRGRSIIDAQHPHDLFMELAAGYTQPLTEQVSIHLYGGPVGEPALGPVAFMHRPSAIENSAATLGHHWQDSTHIAHGVFTGGLTAWRFRFEGSAFRGAEPDENRADIEMGKINSWSARAWFTPTRDWSVQVSHGHLKKPEAAEPGDIDRTTASITHNLSWSDGSWASSLIWGRNHEQRGNLNSYLLESTANFLDKNYVYTRLELVDKIGLLDENIFGHAGRARLSHVDLFSISPDSVFRVGAFTFGYARDIFADARLRVAVVGDATFNHVPAVLEPIYGSRPVSFHLGLRIRPGKIGGK